MDFPKVNFLDDNHQFVDEASAKAIYNYCQALVPGLLMLHSVTWGHGPLGSDPFPVWYITKPKSTAMYECALIGDLFDRWSKWGSFGHWMVDSRLKAQFS